jgi:four helix bundle protein
MQELVVLVYELTKNLPADEKYGLTSQMRRAVVSVLSNFVEDYLKSSKKEKLVYLERSGTSLLELDAQAEVCLVLTYFAEEDFRAFANKRAEVGYLLHRYKGKIL